MPRTLITIALLISSLALADEKSNYVGLIYPELPKELTPINGGLLRGNISNQGLWYSTIRLNGKLSIAWLARDIRENSNKPRFRVVDVVTLPDQTKDEKLHDGSDIDCYFNGIKDISILAIGKWTWRKNGTGYAHHIRHAWRLHPTDDKYESISPQNVRCQLDEDRD